MITKAKTSVSGFRLREGNDIGCKVTLRGRRMYEFLDRLISIALPRIRDFRGVNPNSFDGHGNYSLGLAEQVVFPEIDADKIQHTQGMDITIVTTAKNDDQARELLRHFGVPFRQPGAAARAGSRQMTIRRRPGDVHPSDHRERSTDERVTSNVTGIGRASRGALFPRCWKAEHVDQGPEDQVGDASQVRGSASQPLPPLRTSSRLLSQVRHLPDLLPEPGQPRPDSGSEEGKLVSSALIRRAQFDTTPGGTAMAVPSTPRRCKISPKFVSRSHESPRRPDVLELAGFSRAVPQDSSSLPATVQEGFSPMMTDPIADMLTRIRNAVRIERTFLDMPTSNMRRGIAQVLKDEGYVWDFEEIETVPAGPFACT